jgi:hypothetical protein
LAKRNAGEAPSDRHWPVIQLGLPLDCAHPELSHCHKLLPSGPHPVYSAAGRPSIRRGELQKEIEAEPRTGLCQRNQERCTMSLRNQPTPSNSVGKVCGSVSSPASRESKAGRQQTRVRLTVSLPGDLVDRLRDAVYWSPSLTLAWLIARSLRISLSEMESFRQGPFPKRTNALRAGRPRLLGQTMNVSDRARFTGSRSAWPAEGITRATLVSQPPIE